MGMILVFSIFDLENFENLDILGNWAILTNWENHGQNGNFDIFMLNYGKLAYLGHIGTIGIGN